MGKGSVFERSVATQLSLWYSHGTDDSWIWRTAMSGGRSTVRSRKGKRTSGGAGDLTFTDERAAPLFDLITFELKRGYPKVSLSDLIDRNDGTKPAGFELWVQQAKASARQGHTPYWMIIHKRNNRPAMAYMNRNLFAKLKVETDLGKAAPYVYWYGGVRDGDKASSATIPQGIVGVQFDQFLDLVNPCFLGAAPCPSGKKSSTSSKPGRSTSTRSGS